MKIDFDESVTTTYPRGYVMRDTCENVAPTWAPAPEHGIARVECLPGRSAWSQWRAAISPIPFFMACIDNPQDAGEPYCTIALQAHPSELQAGRAFDKLGEHYALILFGHAGLTVHAKLIGG